MTQPRNTETTVTFYFSLTRNTTNFTSCVLLNSVSPFPLILTSSRLYCFNDHLSFALPNDSLQAAATDPGKRNKACPHLKHKMKLFMSYIFSSIHTPALPCLPEVACLQISKLKFPLSGLSYPICLINSFFLQKPA